MHPLLLGIFGGFLIGAGITAQFERLAAREIAGTLGGKPAVRVRTRASFGAVAGEMVAVRIEASRFETQGLPFHTEPERSKAGKIGRLEIALKDFEVRGLRVKRLETRIPRCRYDRTLALTKKRFRLSESGEGTGLVEVEASALETFARKKFTGIKDLTIGLADDLCTVRGEGDFFLFRGRFDVRARLTSLDGRRILLSDAKIALNDQPASLNLAEAVMKVLNPLLDLDQDLGLEGAMDVKTIRLDRGRLVAEGAARIPVRTAAAQ